jgi:hypothetical protein
VPHGGDLGRVHQRPADQAEQREDPRDGRESAVHRSGSGHQGREQTCPDLQGHRDRHGAQGGGQAQRPHPYRPVQQQPRAHQEHREGDQGGSERTEHPPGQRQGSHRHRQTTDRDHTRKQYGHRGQRPQEPDDRTGPGAARDGRDVVDGPVDGVHHAGRGQEQAEKPGGEREGRRRQARQGCVHTGLEGRRHDRVDEALTQSRVVGEHARHHRHPEQQQREYAQEAVVGDERGIAAAFVIGVLAQHRMREREHRAPPLCPVRPGQHPLPVAALTRAG